MLLCVPTVSAVVLQVATPLVGLIIAPVQVPAIGIPLSLKVTVLPCGTPPNAPITVTESVTDCRYCDGLGDEVKLLNTTLALFTVNVVLLSVAGAKVPSPA